MTQNGETKPMGVFKADALLRVLEETNVSAFLDRWGPMEVLQVYDPDTGMQGILVMDNDTLGPGCGGIRFSPTVTPREVFQRARMMTLTCALVDVGFGGAAGGIRVNPADSDKLSLIRSFARGITNHVPDQFIAMPDLNMGKDEMRTFAHEVGDLLGATGKPVDMGGIPHELGPVGFGMGVVVETYLGAARPSSELPSSLGGARVAVQGLDRVGSTVLRYFVHKGAKIIAASDDTTLLHNPDGLDNGHLLKSLSMPDSKKGLSHFKDASRMPVEDIVKVDCDLLVLSNAFGLVNEDNAASVRARCIVEGTNNPINPIADMMLSKHGVPVLPDLLTVAGGPISSYAEHTRSNVQSAFFMIESRLRDATCNLLQRSLELGLPLRRVATEVAKERILDAMEATQ